MNRNELGWRYLDQHQQIIERNQRSNRVLTKTLHLFFYFFALTLFRYFNMLIPKQNRKLIYEALFKGTHKQHWERRSNMTGNRSFALCWEQESVTEEASL